MAENCKHGKPVATKRDSDLWLSRPNCVWRGDCSCPECARVCWEGACAATACEPAKKETPDAP